MTLSRKTSIFFLSMASLLIGALLLISYLSFRHMYLQSAEIRARTAAEIVRVHLTESMVNGTISMRQQFFERLNGVNGLQHTRIIRGNGVISQHGSGLETEQKPDPIEQRVLESATPYFELTADDNGPILRATLPYIASADGTPNCLSCHQVKSGTVLGAITLHVSVAEQRAQAALTIGVVIVLVSLFALSATFFTLRTVRPIVQIAQQVHSAVETAQGGDYSHRILTQRDDELGQIAAGLNRLLEHLSTGLRTISQKVSHLIRYNLPPSENLLGSTIEMVDCLEQVSAFKQAIEEDETKDEVYGRLARVLLEEFMLQHFTIYEVSPSNNRMSVVNVDGVPYGECEWCDQQILLRSDACRAKRTGHLVNSVENEGICTSFATCGALDGCNHICIPVIQSGSVGSVIQLVTDRVQAPLLDKMLPFISVYLRESAPVLESKRLMDRLRENSLRDAMTGLHNRRFLQEYADTLISYSDRNKKGFAVLMADLDYFKQVNDTYGHEAGDATLKQLAAVLKTTVRSSDLIIRYGGEEFLLILRDTTPETAAITAEKIRQAVEGMKIQLQGSTIRKTISIGIASYPDDSQTFWQVVKYADVALYRAKEAGRNRVLKFEASMWQEKEAY